METLQLTTDRDRPRVPRSTAVRTHVVVGLAAVLAGAGAWVAAGTDTWGQLLAVEIALLLALGWVLLGVGSGAQRAGRLVLEQRAGALRLPGSSTMWRLVLALLALSMLLPLTVLGSWSARGTLAGSAYAAGVSLVLLVLAVPIGVQVLRGRIRAPYLELDETGLTHRSLNAITTVGWDEMSGVRLQADPGRRLMIESRRTPCREARSATPGERTVGGPATAPNEVSVPVAFLGSDAALVADLVEDLRAQPSLRAGLGTGAMIERLSRR